MNVPDISDLLGKPCDPYGVRGISCVGLVLEIYKRAGVILSDPYEDPDGAEKEWREVAQPEPGDLLGCLSADGVTHYALFLGSNEYVHANESSGVCVVTESDLPEGRFYRCLP